MINSNKYNYSFEPNNPNQIHRVNKIISHIAVGLERVSRTNHETCGTQQLWKGIRESKVEQTNHELAILPQQLQHHRRTSHKKHETYVGARSLKQQCTDSDF